MRDFPYQVVLASASPRRRELLSTLLHRFEVVVSEVDEHEELVPEETATVLARLKAEAVQKIRPDAIVIGADTVVAVDGEQLAKPETPEEAASMLRKLSGKTHRVITGVCLLWPGCGLSFHTTSRVTFRPISEDEIRGYVATGEPMDKAGGYAIQGGAEGFVERLEGSLSNVIGLPLEDLEKALQDFDGPPDQG